MGKKKIIPLRYISPLLVLKHHRYLKIDENIYEKDGIYVNLNIDNIYVIYEYIEGNKEILEEVFGTINLDSSLIKIDRKLKINYILDGR